MGLDNPVHIAFIVVILLLVFGARRLPEIGRSLGSGMREFKDSLMGDSKPALNAAAQQPAQPVARASRLGLRLAQHRGAPLEQQRRAAAPAVGGTAGVHGPAGATRAAHPGLSRAQQPLDLAELRVGLLQLSGPAGEHVETVVVADGHLVRQTPEVPGERGDALGQRHAFAPQLGEGAAWDGPTRPVRLRAGWGREALHRGGSVRFGRRRHALNPRGEIIEMRLSIGAGGTHRCLSGFRAARRPVL
jgi:sec-independent protein translocase protein TatA